MPARSSARGDVQIHRSEVRIRRRQATRLRTRGAVLEVDIVQGHVARSVKGADGAEANSDRIVGKIGQGHIHRIPRGGGRRLGRARLAPQIVLPAVGRRPDVQSHRARILPKHMLPERHRRIRQAADVH